MTATLTAPATGTLRDPATGTLRTAQWLRAADLAAVLLFAVEGALLAIAAGLDVIGVLVAAFVSALGGGLIRDVLCHAAPPAALRSVTYPATALLGGCVAILGHQVLAPVPLAVRAPFDAAALGLFCAVGALKATEFRMRPPAAVALGAVSAVGGGVIRDVLLGVVPAALRADMGAVAAACGAGVTVLALRCGRSRATAGALGFATCVTLSLVSAAWGWRLPPVAA